VKTKTMNKIVLAVAIIVVMPFAGMQFYGSETLLQTEVKCPLYIGKGTIMDRGVGLDPIIIDQDAHIFCSGKCSGHILEVR